MNKTVIQGHTLILFSSLIIGFVAFQSGYFKIGTAPVPLNPNGTVLKSQHPQDSTKLKAADQKKTPVLPSSKVIIIKEPLLDSIPKANPELDTSLIKKPTFFSGSKSAPILREISPKELRKMKRRDKKRYRQQEKERKKAAKNQSND